MTEFEWVRELNEGVKKIYSDMSDAGLSEPEYIETPNTVKLILRNNIDERTAHRNKTSDKASSEALYEALNADEKIIVKLITGDPSIKQEEISKESGFSRSKVQRIMKKLSDSHVIYREGAKKDGFWRVGVQ